MTDPLEIDILYEVKYMPLARRRAVACSVHGAALVEQDPAEPGIWNAITPWMQPDAALTAAEFVLSGDPRHLTEPKMLLSMAACLIVAAYTVREAAGDSGDDGVAGDGA